MKAVAAFPVPPLVEVTGLVVFVYEPSVVPTTLTEKTHHEYGAMVAPLSLIVEVPAVATMVPPSHEPIMLLGVAISSPAGSVSLKPTPVRFTLFATLTMRKLNQVVVLTLTSSSPKNLNMTGGATTTIRAEALPPGPPSTEVTTLVVLVKAPGDLPTTLTKNVQPVPAGRTAPLRLMLLEPGAAVMMPPPQAPARPDRK